MIGKEVRAGSTDTDYHQYRFLGEAGSPNVAGVHLPLTPVGVPSWGRKGPSHGPRDH
jgi:hypothetical protein